MSKIIAAIITSAILFSIIGGWMEGAGGLVATQLSAGLSATATSVSADTTGWLASDIFTIDDETFAYTSIDATHFLGVTRGVYDTTPAVHKSGAYVYSQSTAAINRALGYNVAAIAVSNGLYTVAVVPYKFFTVTLPYCISSDYPMFDGYMVIVRYIFMAIGVSVIIIIAIAIGQVVGYSLRRS
jgi:hypothetical protein